MACCAACRRPVATSACTWLEFGVGLGVGFGVGFGVGVGVGVGLGVGLGLEMATATAVIAALPLTVWRTWSGRGEG